MKYHLLATGLVLLCQMAFGQSITTITSVDSSFYIYLLMGQSNMAGRGKITDEYKAVSSPDVLMLNKANEWMTASHPLHFDKPIAGVGPGLAFALTISENYPHKKIGLIPCAVGGTSINKWVPGSYDSPTNTHPWDDAEIRIKEGMKYGVIKGVIWHQGESDSNSEAAKLYMSKLSELIVRVRKETNSDTLPFVVGKLGMYKDNYQIINEILVQLPEKVVFTSVVSSEGLVHNGDGVHFDSKSADEVGKRFAKAMLELSR